MKGTKRNDIALILILAVSAVLVWLCFSLLSPEGDYVVVTVDGVEKARYPITEDTEVRLEKVDGYNILVIRDGHADVTDASCPDGLCVDFHPISHDGETIVCLPNKTVVSIEAGDK